MTWGVDPEGTRELLQNIGMPAIFIAGNGERALRELRNGRDGDARELWMRDHHSAETYAFIETFVESTTVDVQGLGPVRFCHGSPRSDIEIVTPATSEERIIAMTDGMAERVMLTGHTHLQFDRVVAGIRSVNPGSVGMPYHELRGAFWAILGPDVDLRRSEYDLSETTAAYESSDDPLSKEMVDVLVNPPSPEEVTTYGESIQFRE